MEGQGVLEAHPGLENSNPVHVESCDMSKEWISLLVSQGKKPHSGNSRDSDPKPSFVSLYKH